MPTRRNATFRFVYETNETSDVVRGQVLISDTGMAIDIPEYSCRIVGKPNGFGGFEGAQYGVSQARWSRTADDEYHGSWYEEGHRCLFIIELEE